MVNCVLNEFNLINLKLNQYDNNILEKLNEIFQKENANGQQST